jgi:AcrR family transcriptional regulator
VSPRPYDLGRRQQASALTRARILEATRDLLRSGGGQGFTVDAVARRAGVARMTVYYQFGSRAGLLEALFDSLAGRGGMERLAGVFRLPTALEALDGLLGVFCGFWASDRLVIRRVRALGALDADFERSLHARDEGRRRAVRTILGRVAGEHGRPGAESMDEAVDVLLLLSGFETFDALAVPGRDVAGVTSLLQRLARAALGV